MSTSIYIVRHGQSQGNVAEKSKTPVNWGQWGKFEAPPTTLGKRQAKAIALKLQDVTFDAIFSSDLNRARETAEIISKKSGVAVQTESTIRERNFGKYLFGLSSDERKKVRIAVEELNEEDRWIHKYSVDGESIKEAIERFTAFLKKIIPLYKGKTILVVNHGNIMRMFLVHLRWAKFSELPAGAIANTGYFVLETDGKTFHIKDTHGVNKKI